MRKSILRVLLEIGLLLLAVPPECAIGQAQEQQAAITPDIVELDSNNDQAAIGGGSSNNSSTFLLLDASNLGTGRAFYSRDSVVLKVGGKTKIFQRVLGDADNNNHFVGESSTGDSLQLLRYISSSTQREILIGSLVELDTKLIYQFKSEDYDDDVTAAQTTNSSSRSSDPQILLQARVRPSQDFPLPGDPLELDHDTAEFMVQFHDQSMQPNYEFQSVIPEDASTTNITSSARANSYKNNVDVISLMLIWSKQAECKQSNLPEGCIVTQQTEDNMRALIDAAVAESNAAYNLSSIDIQLDLVHAYRHPTYKESEFIDNDILDLGIYANTLGRMSIPLDGTLDDVQWKRRKYKADMVSMFIDDQTLCGIGYVGIGYFPVPAAPFMYSVLSYECATGRFVLAHELGHNMGCAHDRGTDNQCSAAWFYYAHGWRDPDCLFHTVMAYPCLRGQCDDLQCSSCPGIPRFSDPDATYQGKPLGNRRNDCARHIRRTGPRIAKFYKEDKEEDICDPEDTSCQVGGIICFAPDMTAMVKDRGFVAMKDLQVGDQVWTTKEYETIYSINHYHKSRATEFLQIFSENMIEPLELSPYHMLFVKGLEHPIPANGIKPGRQSIRVAPVIHHYNESSPERSYSRVTNISSVMRYGYYNVLTKSGTVVVNGVVASTYASVPLGNDHFPSPFTLKNGIIHIGSRPVISYQRFMQMLWSPYRASSLMRLHLSQTCRENDVEEYRSMYSLWGLRIFGWWQRQSSIIQVGIFFLLLLVLGVLDITLCILTMSIDKPQTALVALVCLPLIGGRLNQTRRRKKSLE